MRKQLPETGAQRYRKFFALFPVRIGLKVRWLETVRILQVYERPPYGQPGWHNVRFVPWVPSDDEG